MLSIKTETKLDTIDRDNRKGSVTSVASVRGDVTRDTRDTRDVSQHCPASQCVCSIRNQSHYLTRFISHCLI